VELSHKWCWLQSRCSVASVQSVQSFGLFSFQLKSVEFVGSSQILLVVRAWPSLLPARK